MCVYVFLKLYYSYRCLYINPHFALCVICILDYNTFAQYNNANSNLMYMYNLSGNQILKASIQYQDKN